MHKLKIVIFSVLLVTMSLLTVLLPKRDSSFFENRSLEKAPVFSKSAFFSGAYLKSVETYIQDHFAFRDQMLEINIAKDMLLHKPVINNVVVTPQYLLPYVAQTRDTYDAEDMTQMIEKLTALNTYGKQHDIHFLYVGIPEQSSAYKRYYPDYLASESIKNHTETVSKDFFANLAKAHISYVNMDTAFAENPQAYYSKTDHHYNFYGAYQTYQAICQAIGQNFFAIDRMEHLQITAVDTNFIGSRNRKLFHAYQSDDMQYTYAVDDSIPFTRYDNGKEVAATLFNENNANIYNYYMGGDIAETIIKTNRPALKNALIVGDSFTNPLETMLYTSFNETRSLDFRYYNKQGLYDYLQQYHPDVLIYVRDDLSYLSGVGNGALQ